MTWFGFSIFSVFALAVAELTQQKLLNKKNAFNEKASAFLTVFIQVPISLVFVFLMDLEEQLFSIFNKEIFLLVVLVTFISAIANVFYFKSFRVKNISISTILVSFSVIVSTTLGIVFFSESTSFIKFGGIVLVLLAIFVVNYKNSILEKNHLFGLVAGVMFGITYTLDKAILFEVHPLVYIFWAFLMISLWGLVLYFKDVVSSIKGKGMILYKPIVMSAAGYFLYNFFTFNSYRVGGEVGRVDAINNSQIFLIILFEYFVLKNMKGVFRKIVSAVVAIIGIYLLSLN